MIGDKQTHDRVGMSIPLYDIFGRFWDKMNSLSVIFPSFDFLYPLFSHNFFLKTQTQNSIFQTPSLQDYLIEKFPFLSFSEQYWRYFDSHLTN